MDHDQPKRRAGLVPVAIAVTGEHFKIIMTVGQPRKGRAPPRAGLHPVVIQPLETIAELDVFRGVEIESGKFDLQAAMPWRQFKTYSGRGQIGHAIRRLRVRQNPAILCHHPAIQRDTGEQGWRRFQIFVQNGRKHHHQCRFHRKPQPAVAAAQHIR